MRILYFSGAFALSLWLSVSAFSQTSCPSGMTVTELSAFLSGGPCLVGNGIVLYAPLTLQSSSMPVTKAHPNVSTDDITIQFGYTATTPPTVSMVAECAVCAVAGAQATQVEVGGYFTGTFNNFGALMANWSPPPSAVQPLSHEYCMPFAELDAELGAGTGAGVEVVRTAATYENTQTLNYVSGSLTFTSPQPVTFNLMQASFGCTYTTSYSATIYFSQPVPTGAGVKR